MLTTPAQSSRQLGDFTIVFPERLRQILEEAKILGEAAAKARREGLTERADIIAAAIRENQRKQGEEVARQIREGGLPTDFVPPVTTDSGLIDSSIMAGLGGSLPLLLIIGLGALLLLRK